MSSGKLGALVCTNAANNKIYTVPSGKSSIANILLVNKNSSAIPCAVYIAPADTPVDVDMILPGGFEVPANSRVELTANAMSAGERVIVVPVGTGIICRVHGYEE